MATVNVDRTLSDPFYRYKMPKLVVKVEGKGNGIKTVITNMVDIGRALNRPPMYATKYFSCVLGAQVKADLKNGRYIINGVHESSKLQEFLDGFIEKYVLCKSCRNPETILNCFQKSATIVITCSACGYSGTITKDDKLAAYILKSLPIDKSSAKKKNEKRTKKKKYSSKQSQEKEFGYDEDDLKQVYLDPCQDRQTEEDDWSEYVTDAAKHKRMDQLSARAKTLVLHDDLRKSCRDRLQIFFQWIHGKVLNPDIAFESESLNHIVTEAERLDIREKGVIILCEILFNEKIVQQIKTHRFLFLRFTEGSTKAQKYILRGFELTVKLFQQTLLHRVSHILNVFYQEDILTERVLLDWGLKKNDKIVGIELSQAIHMKARPFLSWLKQAEEEERNDIQ